MISQNFSLVQCVEQRLMQLWLKNGSTSRILSDLQCVSAGQYTIQIPETHSKQDIKSCGQKLCFHDPAHHNTIQSWMHEVFNIRSGCLQGRPAGPAS
jgi:hypothetical protein